MKERADDTGFSGIRLIQDTEAFCYGIDAVLLAHFAAAGGHRSYIDLGTNNGIIPLLLSSMTEAERLCGVEVQPAAAELAVRNVRNNGLEERIDIICCDVLELEAYTAPGEFRAVVSNPPYIRKGSGLKNTRTPMMAARHETTASLGDFVRCASRLLGDRGSFYMIHRPDRLADIVYACRQAALEPKVMRFVSPRRDRAPNLLLLECRKFGRPGLKMLDPLSVYEDDGSYTEEILRIYGRAPEK